MQVELSSLADPAVGQMLSTRRYALLGFEGGSLAVMTTLPGSKSLENGLRQGFSHVYTRAILVRPSKAERQ